MFAVTQRFIIVIVTFQLCRSRYILQADIQNVSVWLVANKLKLNIVYADWFPPALTCFLTITSVCYKVFGCVYFDHHLTWDSHVIYVLQRVRRKLYQLRPTAPKVLLLLYQVFV